MKKITAALAATILTAGAVLLGITTTAQADTSQYVAGSCDAGGYQHNADAILITHVDGTHDWGDTDLYNQHSASVLFYEINGNTGGTIAVLSEGAFVGQRHYSWPDTNSHLYVASNVYLKAHFSDTNGHTCDVWMYLDGHSAIRNG